MYKNQNTKGHGFFRKSKAYGLVCGIALAGAFTLATSQVSADQVTTQATTQTVTQNQAETVTSTQLDKAVATAKKAAVAVTTTAAVNHATTTDAQADLANQTQTVKDVTAKAQANTQAIKDATAENAKIDAENKAESQRVSQLNAQTKAKIDAENKDAQAKADATNAQLQKDYQAKLAKIKSVEAYNAGVRQRNKDAQAKADATNAQLQKDYQAKLALYNQALKAKAEADKQSINNVAFDIKAQAKGVDNAEYGNSIMTAKTKPDGSFEFNHDMIDGVAQIDFGNGYTGNIVVNDLTTPEIHKDVLDKEDGKSINNGTVKLGDEVTYKLEGWVVPTGRSYDLFEYKFVDQLQRTHDLYLRDKVVAKVDVTLKDGTVIKKGTNLGEYTETVYNKKTGLYELVFKKDFLEKVARSSEFGADDFVVVKRIKAGDVYNTADFFINGNKVKTETVVTHTPEKPKPVEPQKATPKAPAKGLPQTGEASVAPLTALGAIILSAIGLAGFKKRKEN
ncbi:TPA: LPXTG cell wall anchor domain-containing protein [Streptococcus agalactiae]